MKGANGAIVGVVALVVQVGALTGMAGLANRFDVVLMVQQQLVPAFEHQRRQKNKAQQSSFYLYLRLLHTAIRERNVQM